jgi:hypothetical protein
MIPEALPVKSREILIFLSVIPVFSNFPGIRSINQVGQAVPFRPRQPGG